MFPLTYPFIGFGHRNVVEVYELLRRLPQELFRLRIPYVIGENECIKARCEDYYSKQRLTNAVSSWRFKVPQVLDDFPIKVILKNKMPKYVTFQCILNERISDHGFLSKIMSENQIDSRRCYFDHGWQERGGYKVIFRADPICSRKIYERNFRLSIRQQSVYCKVVDNPYANLFHTRLPEVQT
jgi:hypothetical protein